MPGETKPSFFSEDPLETAQRLKDFGISGILFQDLNITPVGHNPNLAVIKTIHQKFEIPFCVAGSFKTEQEIEGYVTAGADFIILGTIAYQKPDFLEKVCTRFPGKIAAKIEVRHGKVTIPGYAVAPHKTPLDYAQYFTGNGVRYLLYSDVDNDGYIAQGGIENLEAFCSCVNARVIAASEVKNLGEIEKIITRSIPRLEGLVLGKSIYDGHIDLKSAITMVNDLIVSSENDITLTEM